MRNVICASSLTHAVRKNTIIRRKIVATVHAIAGGTAGRVESRKDEMRYHAIADMTTKSTAAASARATAEPGMLVLLCVAAWLVPGAGHLWMGRRQKGIVFLLALPAMFAIGLLLHGRVFPFEFSEPLVALAAVADLGAGTPWIIARMLDMGSGVVTAASYEYGNTFLIVSGLLNALVVLDAFDIGMGRK